MDKILLTEDYNIPNEINSDKEYELLEDCRIVLADIKMFTNDLKTADNNKFDELLKVLHGRFSKLELNVNKLKVL